MAIPQGLNMVHPIRLCRSMEVRLNQHHQQAHKKYHNHCNQDRNLRQRTGINLKTGKLSLELVSNSRNSLSIQRSLLVQSLVVLQGLPLLPA
jgi:hypothetical protein